MKKISFDKPLLFVGMIISAILGKIVRYTVMYKTLVLPGIGWHLLDSVNSNNLHFGFTMSGTEINETVSNATQNACFIFSKLNFLNIADSYYGYEILISIVFNVLVFFLFTNNKRKYYRMNDSLFIFASVAVLNIFDFV